MKAVLVTVLTIMVVCGQWAVSRIAWQSMRRYYPLEVLTQMHPFNLFFPPMRIANFKWKARLLHFSGSASTLAAIVLMFVFKYSEDYPLLYRIFNDLKSGMVSAFALGIVYAFLLFILRQRASIYIHTLALFFILIIILPTISFNWLGKAALSGTAGKVIAMLIFDQALRLNPKLKNNLLLSLSQLGIVHPPGERPFYKRHWRKANGGNGKWNARKIKKPFFHDKKVR